MQRVLGVGGFHHRVSHRLTVRQPQKGRDGVWVKPSMEDAMAETGFQEVETYVSCRQNTVVQYIATRPIIDLCMAAKRRPGTRVSVWWWEQEGLDLEGMRKTARETEKTEWGGERDETETVKDD